MKKLLWVGDAACGSGFARATHETLDVLRREYEVTVLGINYLGDPHNYPYNIYAAAAGGDAMGVERLIYMCDLVSPDVVILQNDPWNIPAYTNRMKHIKEYAKTPIIGAVAVDGKNCAGGSLKGLSKAIFWTSFGFFEAKAGGYSGPATVIPLGVDLEVYHPTDKAAARRQRCLPLSMEDAFIVGNVGRNQPRKRLDLTIRYFAEWVNTKMVKDAYLYLHVAPTGDMGINITQLATYYGIIERIILMEPAPWNGIAEDEMAATYNCMDVGINTSQGEGFGLPVLEMMACGVPVIAPDWSGLGDWAKGAAWLVPCSSTAIGPPYLNVLGGIADQRQFVMALDRLYRDPKAREINRAAALERAGQDRFRWKNIGEAFLAAVNATLETKPVEQQVEEMATP